MNQLSKIATLIIGSLIAVCFAFILGKCSGDAKVIYKPSKPDIVYVDSGKINIQIDSFFVIGKAKIRDRIDTLIIIKDGKPVYDIYTNTFAYLDTTLNVNVSVHQIDSLNNIDSTYCRSLRIMLNNKFSFYDSTFHVAVNQDLEPLHFVTKTIIKQMQQEELHWTRSDWFLACTHTATAISFLYIGTQVSK